MDIYQKGELSSRTAPLAYKIIVLSHNVKVKNRQFLVGTVIGLPRFDLAIPSSLMSTETEKKRCKDQSLVCMFVFTKMSLAVSLMSPAFFHR